MYDWVLFFCDPMSTWLAPATISQSCKTGCEAVSKDDLTYEEIDRISQTAPPFRKLWLSGGEPFLREELAEIVAMFVRRNGVRNVNLPTNGLLPEKLFPAMDRMLALCP